MLAKVHEHIVGELNQGARTDTIFIISAIVFDFIVLGINSGIASNATSRHSDPSNDILMVVFIILVLIVNTITVTGLTLGKQTRNKLLSGLIQMYTDKEVAQYYEGSLLANYNKRYTLFTIIVACLAATAIVVPLILRFL